MLCCANTSPELETAFVVSPTLNFKSRRLEQSKSRTLHCTKWMATSS